MRYIYTLSDSTGIRYVGKTNNIKIRFSNHICESRSKTKNNHRINWLKSLAKGGEKPVIEILDVVTKDSWVFWEIYWISQLKSWGFSLTNGTLGGENPPSFQGKTHTKKYRNQLRNRMILNNPAKNMNDVWAKKISIANKDRVFSEEHKKLLGKPIIQLSLNGDFIKKWDSAACAYQSLNINSGNIRMCVRGERKTAGKYKWK